MSEHEHEFDESALLEESGADENDLSFEESDLKYFLIKLIIDLYDLLQVNIALSV
jgi:hypothetical protein